MTLPPRAAALSAARRAQLEAIRGRALAIAVVDLLTLLPQSMRNLGLAADMERALKPHVLDALLQAESSHPAALEGGGQGEPDDWSVTVSRAGDSVVTIEPRMLSGRELSANDEAAIRIAARCLLSFVGDREDS